MRSQNVKTIDGRGGGGVIYTEWRVRRVSRQWVCKRLAACLFFGVDEAHEDPFVSVPSRRRTIFLHRELKRVSRAPLIIWKNTPLVDHAAGFRFFPQTIGNQSL